jgi:hypothetical protein
LIPGQHARVILTPAMEEVSSETLAFSRQ